MKLSTTYETVKNDTFELISRKVYGVDTEGGRIARANPGAIEPIIAGTTLTIPDLPGSPSNLPSQAEISDLDEVSVLIDQDRFRFWEQLSLTDTIDSFGTLTFSAPFEANRQDFREAFRPFSFKPVEVFSGTDRVFKGTILLVLPDLKPKRKTITVSCYSTPGVLNDCNPPSSAFPLELSGFGLRDIAFTIAGYFGIGVDFQVGQGAIFDRVACEPGKKSLQFLADLAKQRNIIISDNQDGELRFWRSIETGSPVARLRQGESPLVSIAPRFSPQSFYSEITGIEPAVVGLKGSQYTVKNKFLAGVTRPHTFTAPDTLDADLKSAVDAKAGRMFGDMIGYNVQVDTWRDGNGERWKSNTFVNVVAPDAMIYSEYTFLIRSVTLDRSRDKKSASLELVLPGAFSGSIPEALPWDG